MTTENALVWTGPEHESILYDCERFEPRSHFKSRLSLIVQVNVDLNRTVVVLNSD